MDRLLTELFHFVFLDRLLRSTDPKLYALKGGINLRFFHQSPRFSEDMDLDVYADRVAVETLRKNGYKILRDAAFARVLAAAGIVEVVVNDPAKAKHTETTQRFGASLVLPSGQRVATKVEFSRRGIDDAAVETSRIDPELARRHGRTAYDAPHYDGPSAARQKVGALAGRAQTQARDLFDLYLLDSRGAVDANVLKTIEPKLLAKASTNLANIDYADWEGQVLEFLETDALEDYKGRTRFDQIQLRVLELLDPGR